MLVLSRKRGEIVCIGQNVTITVLGIERNRVKIGVAAPPEVCILREELRDLPEGEGANASGQLQRHL
jgi:carbon storage regulator